MIPCALQHVNSSNCKVSWETLHASKSEEAGEEPGMVETGPKMDPNEWSTWQDTTSKMITLFVSWTILGRPLISQFRMPWETAMVDGVISKKDCNPFPAGVHHQHPQNLGQGNKKRRESYALEVFVFCKDFDFGLGWKHVAWKKNCAGPSFICPAASFGFAFKDPGLPELPGCPMPWRNSLSIQLSIHINPQS